MGKRFYRDLLGMSVKFEFEDKGMAAFRVGEEEPAIILPAIWFEVDNVWDSVQRLTAKGALFTGEPSGYGRVGRLSWTISSATGWGSRIIGPIKK